MNETAIAILRLTEERKNWRKDHPPGFYARPGKKADNSIDLLFWETGIPGKEGTDWAGGIYKVTMNFSENYPSKPPKCKFIPPLYHPNVFLTGDISLNILDENKGIQELLINPNPNPIRSAQGEASRAFVNNRAEYNRRIREQAAQNVPE